METTNPFADGANMPYDHPSVVPDVYGGVWLFAVMDDGGTLCEQCVINPENPVEDVRHTPSPYGASGWGVVGFDTTDNVEDYLQCDHCNKVLVDEVELPDTVLNNVDGHWYVITYGAAPYQIHATDCTTCKKDKDNG